jgi:hypothetical protein
MAGEFVSWRDYEGLANASMGTPESGLIGGTASATDVSELNKALTAGADINAPAVAAGEGFPLRVESLDATLFNVTYRASDVKFWKALYKDSAYNTVEEFNQLLGYGSGVASFMAEGELPTEDDSTYRRNYTRIKFMGVTRRVTHVMSLLKAAHGDVVARETVNGTLFLLRQLERSLFDGDEDLVGIQFDGLEKTLVHSFGNVRQADGQYSGYATDNVIDMRGAPLSEDHIADMTERLISEPNYGAPSDLWLPPAPMKDLSKILYPKERYDLPAPKNGLAGIAIKGIATPFGDISLNSDIFIPTSGLPAVGAIGGGAIPGVPSWQSDPAARAFNNANPGEVAFFTTSEVGVYEYRVVACNRHGKTAPVDAAAAATVTATDNVVDFTIRDSSFGGANAATYYEVYRTVAGADISTARLIFKIPVQPGSEDTARTDMNRFLPGTNKAYMLTQTSDVIKIKQLAPFTKIPLATIDTSIRWMQVLYLALQIMAPNKNGIYTNIGNLETGAFA